MNAQVATSLPMTRRRASWAALSWRAANTPLAALAVTLLVPVVVLFL